MNVNSARNMCITYIKYNANISIYMAYNGETTFVYLQIDERFKKLERSLKLATLNRKQDNKSLQNGEASTIQSWSASRTLT